MELSLISVMYTNPETPVIRILEMLVARFLSNLSLDILIEEACLIFIPPFSATFPWNLDSVMLTCPFSRYSEPACARSTKLFTLVIL